VIGGALLWKLHLSSHGVWKLNCWSQTGEAPEVLSGRRKQELVSCTVRTPEAQAREAKDSLEMGEQHLDFLPPATGLHVLRSCGERAGHVASIFVEIPRDLAGKSVRAALSFELADIAIQFAGALESCALGCDAASGNGVCASELNKLFVRGACVTVTSVSKTKSWRENVPSVRFDLSKTGMCGAISLRLTSQARLSAEP
jgi:hypothetical protein